MKPEEQQRIFDQFQKDTIEHGMEIVVDGVGHRDEDRHYRHLKFTNSGSQIYRFDLITWPGYLAVSGDMGHFIFTRIPDMFEFFRLPMDKPIAVNCINPGYWGEKCCAGEVKEFSEEVFKESVWDYYETWCNDDDDPDGIIKGSITRQLSGVCNEWEAAQWLDYSFLSPVPEFNFQDWFDWVRTKDYCYHYVWILYAIVSGIRCYDKVKQNEKT